MTRVFLLSTGTDVADTAAAAAADVVTTVPYLLLLLVAAAGIGRISRCSRPVSLSTESDGSDDARCMTDSSRLLLLLFSRRLLQYFFTHQSLVARRRRHCSDVSQSGSRTGLL